MASDKQLAANRLNASLSTGPKTDEGKAKSRANAMSHGLAGVGAVVAEAIADRVADRKAKWDREIRPMNSGGDWALDRAVAASIRIEQCEEAFDTIAVEETARARLSWDQDRHLDAVTLAQKLAKQPFLAARQLESTRHGAELKIDLWTLLGRSLEAKEGWSGAEKNTALDLLGHPATLRDGPTPLDPRDGSDPRSHRLGLVTREVDRLTRLKAEALDELDAIRRGHAEASALVVLSPAAMRIQRYEAAAWRRYRSAMNDARASSANHPVVSDRPEHPASVEPVRPTHMEPKTEVAAESASERRARLDDLSEQARDLASRVATDRTPSERRDTLAEIDAVIARMEAANPSLRALDPDRRPNRRQRLALKAQARRA